METKNQINNGTDLIIIESQKKVDFIMNKVKFSKNLSEKERTVLFLILDEKFSFRELSDKLWPNQGEMRIKQMFLRSLRKLKIDMEMLLKH